MFLRSSSRPQPVDCFFCLSPSLLPPVNSNDRKGKGREVGTKWNWHCERCGCWNIRDERGEMISELPAMKTPLMNKTSFELRAKPSSSHLPSTTVASPFCHVCLTNQTLIMNMLANYLPDEDDPTYPSLYADLPDYLHGVHTRYPPVCINCQPAVDHALRKANHRANVDAWGSALRRSDTPESRDRGMGEIWDTMFWRLRGICFGVSAMLSLGVGISSFIRPNSLGLAKEKMGGVRGTTLLMLWHGCSVLWMAWDPYWLRRRNRSRTRITGRRKWLIDMAVIYVLRLGMVVFLWHSCSAGSLPPVILALRAACLIELTLFIHAFTSLKIHAPVRTRPIEPLTLSRPSSPHPNRPTATLHQPAITSRQEQGSNPIFGLPAFTSATTQDEQVLQNEPMDWEPSPTTHRFLRPPGLEDEGRDDWDSFAVNKQRMFAPREGEDETGLESLIAGWGIDPKPPSLRNPDHPSSRMIKVEPGGSGSTSGSTSLSTVQIGELIVRITSSLLTFARIICLILILSSTIDTVKSHFVDQVLSGIEVGTIVMSAILLPKQYPSPRVAILAGDMVLHLVYAVFQRHRLGGALGLEDPWMIGMTWGQWALLNATRAMI